MKHLSRVYLCQNHFVPYHNLYSEEGGGGGGRRRRRKGEEEEEGKGREREDGHHEMKTRLRVAEVQTNDHSAAYINFDHINTSSLNH